MKSLNAHYDTAHPTGTGNTVNKKHVCQVCEKKYTCMNSLMYHTARAHVKEAAEKIRSYGRPVPKTMYKKHVCQLCEKTFKQDKGLVYHTKFVHSADSDQHKVACGACCQMFTTMQKLTFHTARYHGKDAAEKITGGKPTKERKFVCDICDKRYMSKQGLQKHLMSAH